MYISTKFVSDLQKFIYHSFFCILFMTAKGLIMHGKVIFIKKMIMTNDNDDSDYDTDDLYGIDNISSDNGYYSKCYFHVLSC